MAQYNLFKVNGKIGYKDSEGNTVIEPQYDDIKIIQDKIIIAKEGRVGLLDKEGRIIINPSYKKIENVHIQEGASVTLKKVEDSYKFEIVPCAFSKEHTFDTNEMSDFYHKTIIWGRDDVGVSNFMWEKRKETWSTEDTKSIADQFLHESLLSKSLSGKREHIESIIITAFFDSFNFDNIFILTTGEYSELFSIKEGIIPQSRFDEIRPLNNTCFAVRKSDKWGVYIKDSYKPMIDCIYDRIIYDGGAVVLLCDNSLWGAKSLTLDVNIPIAFKEVIILDPAQIFDKKTSLFCVRKERMLGDGKIVGEEYTIVDNLGNSIINKNDLWLDSPCKFYNRNRILSSVKKKYGFLSVYGYATIPFKYDVITEREDGLFDVGITIQKEDVALEEVSRKAWGVLDINGIEIVPVKYNYKIPLNWSGCTVRDALTKKIGILSENGSEQFPTIFDDIKMPEGQDDYCFFGYNNYLFDDEDSLPSYDECKWGCMNRNGKILIDPIYDCFRIVKGYILAGRNGEIFQPGIYANEFGDYNGVWDLYSPQGKLLIGGFDILEYNSENDIFLLFFGGEWNVERVDYGDYESELIYHFNEKNGRWLIIDKNLKSIIRKKDGSDYHFAEGSIFNVTTREEDEVSSSPQIVESFSKETPKPRNSIFAKLSKNKPISKKRTVIKRYWNFPLELFSLTKPEISNGIAVIKSESKKVAIRIADAKYSQTFDDIKVVGDNTFITAKRNEGSTYYGLYTIENTIIGTEEKYIFLTKPVKGIVFGVQSDKYLSDEDVVNLQCVNTNITPTANYTAIEGISFKNLVWVMEKGELELFTHTNENDSGLLYVRNKGLFDANFLESFPFNIIQEERIYNEDMYWYSDVYELKYSVEEKEQHRIEEYRANERETPDYLRDTWDAMTDGMYGDMPDGFSGDFDFLGR